MSSNLNREELGIQVFGFTRVLTLENTLESLDRQGYLDCVDLWIDGDQGNEALREKLLITQKMTKNLPVRSHNYHRGQLGFRKLILLAMQAAVQKYKYIIFLEDDCFPTKNAINQFCKELQEIEHDDEVFSVYGHPFLMNEDTGYSTRFQGWGWATTAEKLKPYLEKLIDCYSMYEPTYLEFVNNNLTPEVLARLDVTPPRLPSYTLKNFYAWDETLALLTAMDQKKHKLTSQRTIYNCGIGGDSAHFEVEQRFFIPPFNMILDTDVWEYF